MKGAPSPVRGCRGQGQCGWAQGDGGVGHGGGGHSWASSIPGLWASLIFPSSSIAWLEGREGTHLCLAWCVPSPGALGWTRRSSKPDWESVQTGRQRGHLGSCPRTRGN